MCFTVFDICGGHRHSTYTRIMCHFLDGRFNRLNCKTDNRGTHAWYRRRAVAVHCLRDNSTAKKRRCCMSAYGAQCAYRPPKQSERRRAHGKYMYVNRKIMSCRGTLKAISPRSSKSIQNIYFEVYMIEEMAYHGTKRGFQLVAYSVLAYGSRVLI